MGSDGRQTRDTKFVGALHGQRARRGVFITTADFSREAAEYASQIEDKIILVNGDTLAQLMIDRSRHRGVESYRIRDKTSRFRFHH